MSDRGYKWLIAEMSKLMEPSILKEFELMYEALQSKCNGFESKAAVLLDERDKAKAEIENLRERNEALKKEADALTGQHRAMTVDYHRVVGEWRRCDKAYGELVGAIRKLPGFEVTWSNPARRPLKAGDIVLWRNCTRFVVADEAENGFVVIYKDDAPNGLNVRAGDCVLMRTAGCSQ
ncbi:MAG: hypothetical protein EKK62_09495 [Acidimicrobiia bacterium]|nr:MAG: hypothetical protein EKK62_09495 [Acidimicrobiia bacterium]